MQIHFFQCLFSAFLILKSFMLRRQGTDCRENSWEVFRYNSLLSEDLFGTLSPQGLRCSLLSANQSDSLHKEIEGFGMLARNLPGIRSECAQNPEGPEIEKIQDRPPGLKFSSEIEHFKRATRQCLILWGILKVKIEIFKLKD